MRAHLNAVTLGLQWPFANWNAGELRCESGGAIVVNIAGKDYAVNGMASSRYPPEGNHPAFKSREWRSVD